MKIQRISNAF